MPDTRLFNRDYELRIYSTTSPIYDEEFDVQVEDRTQGVIITEARIEFEIERNLGKHPNQCRVTISNLNEDTRAAFKKRPLKIVLEAGYKDDKRSVIFQGDITHGLSMLKGTTWETAIDVADGDRVLATARIARSYKPGTKTGTILTDAFESVGQQLPESLRNSDIFNKVMNAGYTAFGKYKDVVTDLIKPHGYTWSIQDEQPQLLRSNEYTAVLPIGEQHGMIGSPELGHPTRKGKQPKVKIVMALYPQIRPGHAVDVKTRELEGTFKVLKVRHSGDTHGQDWKTEIELKPIEIGKNARR